MKLHIFAKFSMENLHMDLVCSFLKISDILKRKVISKKSYCMKFSHISESLRVLAHADAF